MKLWKIALVGSLVATAYNPTYADTNPVPEAFQHCTVCHGTQLMGNAANGAPRLSGLQPWYIKNQLMAFRHGWRGEHPEDHRGNEMQAAAKNLTADQLQQAADFVTQTQSPHPAPTLNGNIERGKTLFASCQACHGPDAKGNEVLKAPNISGLNDWYIAQQLSNYLNEKRGYSSGDTNGAIMKASALIVSDEQDITDVASYIVSLNQPSKNTTVDSGDPMNKRTLATAALAASLAVPALAEPKRYPLPNNSTFPIARAVEVPAGTTLIYHSGQVPSPEDTEAEKGSRKYYGDTYTQSMSVFKKFEASLTDIGLDFGDAVKLTVFLVGDPEMEGKMDFGGFMKAYTQYFGTEEQPNLPARSAIQIAGLAGGPGMLVEIEMVLAKPTE